MKKTFSYILAGFALVSGLQSCSFFALDNMDGPKETIVGKVIDVETGEPVLTEQNSRGIRVRLTELSYGDNVSHNPDFYAMPDGTYRNTKIFKGHYNVTVDGPFIPIVRTDPDNFIIEDGSVNTDIRNTTTVNFMVQPFLKVEIVGEPVVSGGVVTAQVLVTRATSKEEFKAKVEPMGGWNDNFTNVTDVRLFVGYSSTVDSNNQYSSWSNVIDYGGDQFEKSIGTPITISSRGTLKAGRKLFIRAAARINYSTAGERRYNFSEVREINVPEAE